MNRRNMLKAGFAAGAVGLAPRWASADVASKDGANPSGVIFDELHRQKSRAMWDVYKYASAAREQPLEHFEERLQRFRAALQKAEDDAEEADLALADGERSLENWLARAKESAPRKEHFS